MTQIPRFAADVFGRCPEDGALDRHSPMRRIVVARGKQAFDGQTEQHDAPHLAVEVPARDFVGCVETRDRPDLEPDVLQLRPGAAQEFDRCADGEVEAVQAPVERRQGRPNDLAATETSVTSVPGAAPRGGGGVGGTATRHDESLGGVRVCGAASPTSMCGRRTLAEMDGRLCSKVGCAREAVATLTYDYGDQMAALGPLGAANDPQAHDLCSPHADRLSVPAGWLVVRHEALRV